MANFLEVNLFAILLGDVQFCAIQLWERMGQPFYHTATAGKGVGVKQQKTQVDPRVTTPYLELKYLKL